MAGNEINSNINDVKQKIAGVGKVYHKSINVNTSAVQIDSLYLPPGHSYIVVGYLYNSTTGKDFGLELSGDIYYLQHSDRSTTGGWRACSATSISPNGGTVRIGMYSPSGASLALSGFLAAISIT